MLKEIFKDHFMTDEEFLDSLSKVEIYCQILLGILRYVPTKQKKSQRECEEIIVKNLKFNNYKEVILLRACIDNLEDTQYAINECFKNGLEISDVNLGERYLRLYGVLNSYYQQMFCLFDLARLFNLTNQSQIKEKFKNFDIIKLRNKIASHPTNYVDDFENKNDFDFYRITQTSLTKWCKNLSIVSHKNKHEEVNLIALMNAFTNSLELELHMVCKKAINSIFKQNSESKSWLLFRLNYAANK